MIGSTKNRVIVLFASISVACALSAPVFLAGQAVAAEAAPATCATSLDPVAPETPGDTNSEVARKIVLISLASSTTTLAAIGFLATRRNNTFFPPLA